MVKEILWHLPALKRLLSGTGHYRTCLEVGEFFIKSKRACVDGGEKAASYLSVKTSGLNITVDMTSVVARWQNDMLAVEQTSFTHNVN